jgi:mono/diheme cytochrome c family protein
MNKTNAFRGMAVGSLALLGVLVSCAGTQTPKDRVADPGQMIFNGQTIADVACYKCHNGDATGTWRGPNLMKETPKMTDQAIADVIFKGPGMMPSYKGKLDEHQVAEITAWLRGRAPAVAP